jgi:hypothetical protein
MFSTHKVIFLLIFLLVTGECISAVSGAELPGAKGRSSSFSDYSFAYKSVSPGQSNASAGGDQGIINPSAIMKKQITQKIARQMSLMQQSKTINSSTCGRPWKHPLAKIQGRIRNVEYRIQPFTGRSGLHLDIETGQQPDTVITVIHVYPERLTAKCPSVFYFRVGDTVTVTGSAFFTGRGGMQQNICAATITEGKEVLGVRDPQTGSLKRQLCCQEICEQNCAGLPPMCDRMCMGNCGNRRLKAVFQNLPFRSSHDKEYTTATSKH